jgi:hypothetical protein
MSTRFAAAAFVFLLTIPAFATQPNPTRKERDLVTEIMRVTHADQMATQVMDAVLEQSQEALLARSKNEDPAETAEVRKSFERFRQLMREKIDFVSLLNDVYVQLYVKYYTDEELEQLVAFYKSSVGQKVITTMPALMKDAMQLSQSVLMPKVNEVTGLFLKELEQAKPWERTMSDMRTLAVSVEAWSTDNDDTYPRASDLEGLRSALEPVYAKELPKKDVWGNKYVYVVSPDAKHYRIVSAGADGILNWDSRQIAPAKEGQALRVTERPEDDIIYADGTFLQVPKASQGKGSAQ